MSFYTVILAGGSGTRLWPLSRELYPKQFLSLPKQKSQSLEKENADRAVQAEEEASTLFLDTVKRVLGKTEPEKIIIVTHKDQAGEIKRRLDRAGLGAVRLLAEPEARNTAPAIGLAAQYIALEAGPEAVMAVLPSDHLIPDHDQFTALLNDGEAAARAYGLVTFGIKPTYPETGFGYICRGEALDEKSYRVARFVEKPDLPTAERYLAEDGYYWNSGMFIFKVGDLLIAYRQHLPQMADSLIALDFADPASLAAIYPTLEKISIDYGILEKSAGVSVIPTAIEWSDLGSWEAYYQIAGHDQDGNFIEGPAIIVDSKNSLIHAGSRLVGAAGIKNLVIVDTPDALLVCDRNRTQEVKQIVDKLKETGAVEAREHRTVYRPWGSYTSLELGKNYQVKRINVNPGARLSLQSHRHRAENWVVVEGEALVTVDDREIVVPRGESAYIPRGARHRMENRGSEPLVLIEVQNGEYLGEDDIVRYEDDYGRTGDTKPPIRGEGWVGSEPTDGQVGLQTRSSSLPLDRSGEPQALVARKDSAGAEVGASSRASQPGSQTARDRFNYWLGQDNLDPEMRAELQAMQDDPGAIEAHFGSELTFGTGGMRGIIGPGLNRINRYIIRRATQGLADYINNQANLPAEGAKKVAIAYDTRHYSGQFAKEAALVLAANGIRALLFSSIRPTPMLSFTTRELGCAAGIVITASHNPPNYNGYKVYGPDGGQAVSPLVDQIIEAIGQVDIFGGVQMISEAEAVQLDLLEIIDPAYDQVYLDKVKALSVKDPHTCLKVVFTPLHGTGSVYIPDLLTTTRCVDLSLVEEQLQPDPDFSTVRVPNPEDPAALEMALQLARRVEAELVLATDPDADRVGTAVRSASGEYVILSGNQVGALLIEYICSSLQAKQALPKNPVLVKTIVTGELGCQIARSYGLQIVETLTGFKFIGEKMKHFEELGEEGPNFIFGYEESCGYLTGTFVRDKDAVISSLLIAEMTAYYKEQGLTLLQVLDRLQQKHGYFAEDLLTIELNDISEADRHVAAYHDLPAEFGGQKISVKRDFGQSKGWQLLEGKEFELDLPVSPVLHYTLEDGSWFAVRPSGTEPKVKFYLSVCDEKQEEAQAKLARLREAVLAVR